MKTIKKYLKPFLTGVLATLLLAFFMLKITMDFQILLFFGTLLFFISGIINSKNKGHYFVKTFLITFIYLALFISTVLAQLPELWYFVLIYFVAALLGVFYTDYKRKVILSLSLLTIAMLFLAIKIIPVDLKNNLTKIKFEALPEFTIHELSGKSVDSKSLKGKVVILDFFGTWCKPCVGELKELDKIQLAFKDDTDVAFYIINANIGGDTPEKFKAFIKKHNYKFKFAYDYDSEIYKLLKLQKLGLPVLLIIDKDQHIRMQHVGYNSAETGFSEQMIKTITSLK